MASFMSFLTRRHAHRTISSFGICLFIVKGLPKRYLKRRFIDEHGPWQAEKVVDSVNDLMRRNRSGIFDSLRGRTFGSCLPGNEIRLLRESSEMILALKTVTFYHKGVDHTAFHSLW
jgi:hypothetical protein